MPDAFFLPTADPDVFVATPWTEGPWQAQTQHAGPPSALLTRSIENLPSSIPGSSQLVRLVVEILGPVGIGEVRATATLARPGKAVELVDAELSVAGRVAMRAHAWRIRSTPVPLPAEVSGHPASAPPIPAAAPPIPAAALPVGTAGRGWIGAVEFRFVTGHFNQPGPAAAWTRLRVAVVDGEAPTPIQRLVAVADGGNGLSSLLPFGTWLFINTDLSLHLHRLPVGDWIYLDARSTIEPNGVGLAETELYDTTGRIGRGAQSLLVGPR